MRCAALYSEWRIKKQEIQKRLSAFKQVKGDDLFYELCFCLLTPQSKAESCDRAVFYLKENDFFHLHINPKKYLRGNVRFHNKKSIYLIEMKSKYGKICKRIATSEGRELRDWLVLNVKGIGYKEASHFLRNIGFRDLAILDRHILKNLKNHQAIHEIPKIITRKKYLEIEDKFHSFSKKIKIPLDEIDLLFWSRETGRIFK